ncbi:SH3 domain-containing protein [Bergeyella sp. RCAD1439]|uniref:SH3 domain-containing protein n=1 Tax=Bergeyella anatis TaxID=3113737 RepID=UPI002E186D6E|nr:SH3 domain-containing protein [Bergeyella sp. RCAD1439]
MKNNRWIFILLAFLPLFLGAQEEDYASSVFYFEKGSKQKVFSDRTKVRTAPNLTAAVLDSLASGQEIEIVKNTEIVTTLGKRSSYWYQIKYGEKTGYMWGGNISLGYRTRDGWLFLFGIGQSENRVLPSGEKSKVNLGSIKVLENNRLLDEAFFDIDSKESMASATFTANKSPFLDGVDYILSASVGGEACGVPTLTQPLLFANRKLIKLPLLLSVSDAGVYYHSEELIFPQNAKSRNLLIFKLEEGESEDEDAPLKVTKKEQKIYLWNGTDLSLKK